MGLNLSVMRSAIWKYLDDDGTRWSAGTGNTLTLDFEVDRAIWFSLQQALRFYIKNGGDGLTIQREFPTDTNGQVELGSGGSSADDDILPGFISNVSIRLNAGDTYWTQCKATRADQVEYPDPTPKQLRVNYVAKPFFDSGTGNLILFGDSQAAGNKLDLQELEILMILYAVRTLLPRDNEQNLALNDAIYQAEISIGATTDSPLAVEFPRYGISNQLAQTWRWAFVPFDHATGKRNVIQLHRPLYSFYGFSS